MAKSDKANKQVKAIEAQYGEKWFRIETVYPPQNPEDTLAYYQKNFPGREYRIVERRIQ